MVTGASTADLAVILIDARKGVLTQTRRHSYLVSLLGIRTSCWRSTRWTWSTTRAGDFEQIVARLPRVRRRSIGLKRHHRHPGVRADGDNVTRASRPACRGTRAPRCCEHLEDVDARTRLQRRSRFACRCNGSTARTWTSAALPAMIASGSVRPGDARARAARRATRAAVARIVTGDGDLPRRVAGQAVTLTLADEIDVSRGDVLAAGDAPPEVARPVRGHGGVDGTRSRCCRAAPTCCKSARETVAATVTPLKYKVNVNTLEHTGGQAARAQRDRRLRAAARSRPSRSSRTPRTAMLGGFILIDRLTNDTVGRRHACTSRCAARRTCTGRRSTSTSRRARARRTSGLRAVVHRTVRRRQVDHREPGREAAARARAGTPTCSTATTCATA